MTALLANAGIAIAKFIGFLVTGSSSMLSESVHSVADTSNQALLLFGGRAAKRQATEQHQFGYARERYFWAFVVSLVLFSLGSLYALFEGFEKIRHPHELSNLPIAIGILIFGIVVEGYALNTAYQEAKKIRGRLSWPQFIRRTRNPELPVVLLEDAGAVLGLCIALAALTTSAVTDDPVWDGIGTLAIGVLLGIIAVILAREMKSLLIGESAVAEERDRLVSAIEGHPNVRSILNLQTQHFGPEEMLVAAKLQFDDHLTTRELSTAINETEVALREAVPAAEYVFIEPDIKWGDEDAGGGTVLEEEE